MMAVYEIHYGRPRFPPAAPQEKKKEAVIVLFTRLDTRRGDRAGCHFNQPPFFISYRVINMRNEKRKEEMSRREDEWIEFERLEPGCGTVMHRVCVRVAGWMLVAYLFKKKKEKKKER